MADGAEVDTLEAKQCMVLLEDNFSLYPKDKPIYKVTCSSISISCVPAGSTDSKDADKKTITFNYTDIVGCDCLKGKKSEDKNAYLVLYCYPHKKKIASKKTSRKRQTLTLTFDKKNTYSENLTQAQKWKHIVTALVKGMNIGSVEGKRAIFVENSRFIILI